MADKKKPEAPVFRPSVWLLMGMSLAAFDTFVIYKYHNDLSSLFLAGLIASTYCALYFFSQQDRSSKLEGALRELKSSEEKLKEAQALVRIGGWETDDHWKALLSPEAAAILGIDDLAEFSGEIEDFYALIHPEDRDRVRETTQNALRDGDRYTTSYRVILKDRRHRYLRDSATVRRDAEGEPVGLNGVVQDITEQVEIDRKLRQAEHWEIVGTLAGGMAHDFGNTLAATLASAELLKHSKEYNPQTVENIIEATDQGAKVVRRMLGYARRIPLSAEFFCLEEQVHRCVQRLQDAVGGSAYIEYTPPISPITIFADKDQLSDALFNVVFNARDASGPDGLIEIECGAATEVDLTGFAQPDGELRKYGVVIVSDPGKGMTEDELKNATQPFFSTKTVSGNGLGLAMVASFIHQSKGQLSIISKRGEGTRVAMFLPTS